VDVKASCWNLQSRYMAQEKHRPALLSFFFFFPPPGSMQRKIRILGVEDVARHPRRDWWTCS
jgi:hypothetical protein